MASAPGEMGPVFGRVDRDGRLVEADAALLRLQTEAGASLGDPVALPQLAAMVRSARKLGVPLSRTVLVASADRDLDLWVRAEPADDGVRLAIEGWTERAPAPPRLMLIDGGYLDDSEVPESGVLGFETDAELRFTHVSPALFRLLEGDNLIGQPLTRYFQLLDAGGGVMPLLLAVGAGEDFDEQPVELKRPQHGRGILSGKALTRRAGRFAGFDAELTLDRQIELPERHDEGMFDPAVDEALRTPLDQIITAADRIVERSDGPLRSDYASYASDIAAAGRHLLSVLKSMNAEAGEEANPVADLVEAANEAIALCTADADARNVQLQAMIPPFDLPVAGERRAILQILVNILSNAVRHSPVADSIDISFTTGDQRASVTIADHGPGIAREDQERIFEKYEQGERPGSTGLGLAISRRIARSLGGDVLVESAPGEGARFILVLPRA